MIKGSDDGWVKNCWLSLVLNTISAVALNFSSPDLSPRSNLVFMSLIVAVNWMMKFSFFQCRISWAFIKFAWRVSSAFNKIISEFNSIICWLFLFTNSAISLLNCSIPLTSNNSRGYLHCDFTFRIRAGISKNDSAFSFMQGFIWTLITWRSFKLFERFSPMYFKLFLLNSTRSRFGLYLKRSPSRDSKSLWLKITTTSWVNDFKSSCVNDFRFERSTVSTFKFGKNLSIPFGK